jgi:hypothetical protein
MPYVNCHKEVKSFHANEVTLPNDDQGEMRDRREAGRDRLKGGLTKAGHEQPSDIQAQGSYAMRTMVQDDECDYDIDDGVYFEKDDLKGANGSELSAKAARQRVADALKDDTLKYEAEVKNNCVRQYYPQGYHIDIPVYRVTRTKDFFDRETVKYELASGDQWVESDARAVTRWYNDQIGSELQRGQEDTSQTRRITKLTKKLARSRPDWKKKTTSGISITKLVIDHIVTVPGRDDRALRQTWQSIKTKLDMSEEIRHPVLTDTNLAENGDSEVKFFRDCLKDALETLNVLDDAGCTRKKAREAWDKVFGCELFSGQPDDDTGAKSGGGITATGTGTAKREDGGRRFG